MSDLVVLAIIGELHRLANNLRGESVSLEANLGSEGRVELLLQFGECNSVLGTLGTSQTGDNGGEVELEGVRVLDGRSLFGVVTEESACLQVSLDGLELLLGSAYYYYC